MKFCKKYPGWIFAYIIGILIVCEVQLIYWKRFLGGMEIQMTLADFFLAVSKLNIFPFTIGICSMYLLQNISLEEWNLNRVVRMGARKKLWTAQVMELAKLSLLLGMIVLLSMTALALVHGLPIENWQKEEGFYFLANQTVPLVINRGWMIFYFAASVWFQLMLGATLLLLLYWWSGSVFLGWIAVGILYIIEDMFINEKFRGIFGGIIHFNAVDRVLSFRAGIGHLLYGICVLVGLYAIGRYRAEKKEFI